MNGSISGSYFTSNQNAFVSSMGDENVGGINNFWEYKDASAESGLKHKSVSHFDLNLLCHTQC